jgi:hypothetical protein
MDKVFSALRLLLTIILLSIVGMTIGVCLRGYAEEQWIEFIPDDGSFATLFPQSPVYEIEPAPFENGQAHLFTAHTPRGSYQIATYNCPTELKSTEAIVVADTVARFGGTLEPGGQPGDFLLLMGDGSVIYCRVLRVRQRIYRMLVSHPTRQEPDEEVRLFFESFAPRN